MNKIEQILNLFGAIGNFTLPIFVFLTMFNVGLTQTIGDFKNYIDEWQFYLRMLGINFILSPLIMFLLLQIFTIPSPLEIGLIIFSLAAGAPFIIKLTQFSGHDIALGATLLLVLVIATSIYLPIALPIFIPGASIGAWSLFWTLFRQMVLPILFGLFLHYFFTDTVEKYQPIVGKAGNLTLWIVVVGVLLGELQGLFQIIGEGAIFTGILFIILITLCGYFLAGKGSSQDHYQDLGALGSGQRNTAACMIVATTNFADLPEVLLIITIVNTVGLVLLILLAKYLSQDNQTSIE